MTGEKLPMAATTERRPGRGCLLAAVLVGGATLAALIGVGIYLGHSAGDPASFGYGLLSVIDGRKSAEQWVTEIIVGRLAAEAGVPPEEAAALEREMGPISEELPRLSEGEKSKLAALIRDAVADGEVTPEELTALREYSYRSARDGNAKP
jgi:hypothetical protein